MGMQLLSGAEMIKFISSRGQIITSLTQRRTLLWMRAIHDQCQTGMEYPTTLMQLFNIAMETLTFSKIINITGLMRKPTPLTEAQVLVILETQENGGLDA